MQKKILEILVDKNGNGVYKFDGHEYPSKEALDTAFGEKITKLKTDKIKNFNCSDLLNQLDKRSSGLYFTIPGIKTLPIWQQLDQWPAIFFKKTHFKKRT